LSSGFWRRRRRRRRRRTRRRLKGLLRRLHVIGPSTNGGIAFFSTFLDEIGKRGTFLDEVRYGGRGDEGW